MEPQEKIDFLAIGHICHDLTAQGKVIGGAAAYASAFANAAGCRTAIVTSSAIENSWKEDLIGIKIHRVPSVDTTVFENVYTSSGRVQTVHSVAERINLEDVPRNWQRASIVHIGPIANEVDPNVISLFSNSILGLAPQGWMRHWDENGHVYKKRWPEAEEFYRKAAVVFLSEEDLPDRQALTLYKQWANLLVLTKGRDGCTIFIKGEAQHFSVDPVPVIDTTGAGDIFAAAFLIRYFQTAGNHVEAACFANRAAAITIRYAGIEAKINALRESSIM